MIRSQNVIVTVGPATNTLKHIQKIKELGVNYIRVNMSHSNIEEFEYFLKLSQKAEIPFIIDTEGSQIRTGNLEENKIFFDQNDLVQIHQENILGNKKEIHIRPNDVVPQLEVGDEIHVDFDTLILEVSDTSNIKDGYITGIVKSPGFTGSNKAVIIKSKSDKKIKRPPLSPKDIQAIEIGLKNNIKDIAVSFVRTSKDILEVREATKNSMSIISKVECQEALNNLKEIIETTDKILIDRGDMSKEVNIQKIPFIQKSIIKQCHQKSKPVFVATNLLESMVEKRMPTIAEINDIANTIIDGSNGLVLAAETAIGKHPIKCISTLMSVINYTELKINEL